MNDVSTVYGPVESWRLGRSLGVDLLCVDSICSFWCVYCQLGRINVRTAGRGVFVTTRRVLEDLSRSDWRGADCVTLSGSGEPTLAANLGEVIRGIKRVTGKPVAVLTNGAHLESPHVRRDLREADSVFCKLDAADEKRFSRTNRPVEGVTLGGVIEGIKQLRAEYDGRLAIQTMLTPLNADSAEDLARVLDEIRPDEVHLCAPTRTVPREWVAAARGNSGAGGARLKQLTPEQVASFGEELSLGPASTYLPVARRQAACEGEPREFTAHVLADEERADDQRKRGRPEAEAAEDAQRDDERHGQVDGQEPLARASGHARPPGAERDVDQEDEDGDK